MHAEGWETGIDVPVNGVNEIDGGFFNDVKGLSISTAMSRSRVVNINGNTDAQGNLDPTEPGRVRTRLKKKKTVPPPPPPKKKTWC